MGVPKGMVGFGGVKVMAKNISIIKEMGGSSWQKGTSGGKEEYLSSPFQLRGEGGKRETVTLNNGIKF